MESFLLQASLVRCGATRQPSCLTCANATRVIGVVTCRPLSPYLDHKKSSNASCATIHQRPWPSVAMPCLPHPTGAH